MAMTTFERRLPRGRISTGDASRIQQQRGGWAMRQAAGQPVRLFQSERSTTWTVAYDEEAFAFQPSPLNRVVTVIPIDTLERLPEAIAPMRPYLQTIGLAAPDKRLAALTRLLMATGVTRVCPLGEMQHPPADWPHDGRPNLLPLLGK
ncbi:MAG: hypothetical protein HY261_03630 [Chloroflexi bacterium]|nr:hypothetical protein [Chloroflexota bacterium]